MSNVVISDEREQNRFKTCSGYSFATLRVFIKWDCHPGEISVVDELVTFGFRRQKEVVFDQVKNIIHNRFDGYFTFIIAIVIKKTIREDLLQTFAFETPISFQMDLFFRWYFSHVAAPLFFCWGSTVLLDAGCAVGGNPERFACIP